MQRYKILTGILLMLSVIDFAFAAPVVVQEREVRVSVVDAANDGTARSPLRRDQSDSGYWRKQVPRYNPGSRTDSNDPSNAAPPIELNDPPTPDVPPGFESASLLSTNQAPTDSNRPSKLAPPIDLYANHDPPTPDVPPGFESAPFLSTNQAPTGSNRPSNLAPPIDLYANHDPPTPSVPPGFESPYFLPTSQAPTDSSSNWPSNSAPPVDLKVNHPPSPSVQPGFEFLPTSQAPTYSWASSSYHPPSPSVPPGFEFKFLPIDEHPLNPSSPHDGSHALNPAFLSDSHPWRLGPPHDYSDSSSLSSFSLQFKSLSDSELMSPPTHEALPPNGPLQIPSSPDDSHSSSTSHVSPPASSLGLPQDDDVYPPTNKFKPLSEILSMPTHDTPPPDGSPQTPSSPENSYSSSSWAQTDSHSGSTSSWSSDYDVSTASSAGSPQDHVPFPPSSELEPPSELMSTDTHETHPPPPGPTNNRPAPASESPSDPGPSKEPNPPPSAKRPRPDEPESWSSLSKIFKGKFKRRFSDSVALNAAQGDLQGTFNSRTYVIATSLSLLSTNDRTVVTDILTS
ncbi:hypothetical protein BGY98DRAFT_180955 [Russula aff. rugulosa BPL654]|nr:hypothetical protein BGY98DRAFT_180955 [Russula aff. rugulosa BPL654]